MSTEPPSDSLTCRCGHLPADHYGGHGQCMASTPTETWACDCAEWRPANEPPSNSWRVPYERGDCPRCGMPLDPPDANLDRSCPVCHVTVCAAEEWIEDVE